MKRKVEVLAARLRDDRSDLLGKDGITVWSLARRYGVAYVTMWKALRILQENGLPLHRSRQDSTGPAATPSQRESNRSEFKAASTIRNEITAGVYRTGTVLPKIAHFTLAHHVSRATVIGALRRLESEGLCTRLGRNYVVGRGTQSGGDQTHTGRILNAPLVLVFAFNESSAQHFHHAERSGVFVKSFYDELEKFGVQTTVLFPDHRGGQRLHSFVGAWSILELKKEFGDRIRGVLIISKKKYISEWNTWIDSLLGLGRPVVWFDTERDTAMAVGGGSERRRVRLYRCTWDDDEALRTALSNLYKLGHRHIGFPNHVKSYVSWIDQRIELARIQAAAVNERASNPQDHLRIHAANHEKFCFDLPRGIDFHSVMQVHRSRSPQPDETRLFQRAASSTFAFRREAVACVPAVAALIREAPVTALVVPNDSVAMHYMAFCSQFEIDVPREMSLLSFDNSLDAKVTPVTTVDYGMGHLGYAAAQLMLGFIPVRVNTGGTIAPQCHLVHRGSLGIPQLHPTLHQKLLSKRSTTAG